MNPFEQELLERSPLAGSVLEIFDFAFDQDLLDGIWETYRGRCYEDVLRFEDFLRIMRDALIRHGGSAHKLYRDLESRGTQPCDESNFYRKLARMPVELSRALLRECTRRLGPLLPESMIRLPACFDGFEVIAGDGKTIKNATKRLKPTRGYRGKLLGAKALVALNLRSSMAVAMSDSLDGLSNEVPLVPQLMPQLYEVAGPRPILSVWDRGFYDLRTMRRLTHRPGDAFVVRMKQNQMPFAVESSVETRDKQGRRALDQIGVLGQGKQAMRVRRITLFRAGEEDVILVSSLLDRDRYSAADVLELYRYRWKIEEAFQQVTETFSLQHLIGCAPKAVLLQFSFCLLLFNVMQVVKAYVAWTGQVMPTIVSMYYLFDDVKAELVAWAYHTAGHWPRKHRDPAGLCRELRRLLKGCWDPIKYTKASDKKPRSKPAAPKRWLKGNHTSVQRALEGRAEVTPP
jgi:hypothetical protein